MSNRTPNKQNTNASTTTVSATPQPPVPTGQMLIELARYAIGTYGPLMVDTLFNDWLLPEMRYRIRVSTRHYDEPSDIIDIDDPSTSEQ